METALDAGTNGPITPKEGYDREIHSLKKSQIKVGVK